MREQWLPVVGWERQYEVSNKGRVKSLKRLDNLGRRVHERILKQQLIGSSATSKRYAVQLSRNGKLTSPLYVHILMLEAFVGPRPEGLVGCHRDDTPRNLLSNLRWDTYSANLFDQVRNGNHPHARKTRCKNDHELTPDNVYIYPRNGQRMCRKCKRRNGQRTRLRQKGLAA